MRLPHLAFAAALLALSGCNIGRSCTAMYAPDALTIVLDGTYADGDYELEVVGGGADVLCTFVVGDGTAETTFCEGQGGEVQFYAGPEGELNSLSLWEHTPDRVTTTLFHNGTEIASEKHNPTYTEDQPNGKGCGDRESAEIFFSW